MVMHLSTKQFQVDRAKAIVVGSTAAAAFLVIFSIIASRALLSQRSYQSRVIKEQEKAVKQLHSNLKAVDELVTSYKQFAEQPTNILGGNSAGQNDKDGDNARIILNALPSKYDFPALQASLEKILTNRNFKVEDLTGTDDEIAQAAKEASGTPTPVEIPFKFSVTGSYNSLQALIDDLHRSIRPIKIQQLSLGGNSSSMHLEVSAVTYYLPEKQVNFPTKVVK